MKQRGFTVIELMSVLVLLLAIGTVFLVQNKNLQVAARDSERKTAINSIYYTLEKVYYPTKKSYPKSITETILPSVEPKLLKDPNGELIGAASSDYRYEPTGCKGDLCTGYILRAQLENEADYVKKSAN